MPEFEPLERPRFFAGQLLTADDLQREQDYFRGQARRHNRYLHRWGIVSGLEVTLDRAEEVCVSPGFALDCAGNELVLPGAERLSLSGVTGRNYVTLHYVEVQVRPQLVHEQPFAGRVEHVDQPAAARDDAGRPDTRPGALISDCEDAFARRQDGCRPPAVDLCDDARTRRRGAERHGPPGRRARERRRRGGLGGRRELADGAAAGEARHDQEQDDGAR